MACPRRRLSAVGRDRLDKEPDRNGSGVLQNRPILEQGVGFELGPHPFDQLGSGGFMRNFNASYRAAVLATAVFLFGEEFNSAWAEYKSTR